MGGSVEGRSRKAEMFPGSSGKISGYMMSILPVT